jgi:hypothetical protein
LSDIATARVVARTCSTLVQPIRVGTGVATVGQGTRQG